MEKSQLQIDVEAMMRAGVPKDKVVEFIKNKTGAQEQPKKDWRHTASSIYTPTMVGAGAMVGGAMGMAGSPFLALAGGAAGGMLGKNAAESADDLLGIGDRKTVKEEIRDLPNELKESFTNELVGMNIGAGFVSVMRGGKAVFKAIKDRKEIVGKAKDALTSTKVGRTFTKEGHTKDAGEILTAHTSAGPLYAKNSKEAAELEKQIPGLKFRKGQAAEDPKMIGLEQKRSARNLDVAEQYTNDMIQNNKAVSEYYKKNFGTESGVDDLLDHLRLEQDALVDSAETAKKEVADLVANMGATDNAKTGEDLISAIKDAKGTARAKAKVLYDSIGDATLDVSTMLDDFKAITKKTHAHENPANIPTVLQQYLDDFTEGAPKKMSLNDLRGLRSDLLGVVRSSSDTNPVLAKRANDAVDAVEAVLKKGGENNRLLKEANNYYRSNYVDVFRHRGVGMILSRGPKGEVTRLRAAEVPAAIWNSKTGFLVDDVTKAIGKKATAEMMTEYAKYDLAESVVNENGEVVGKKLAQWFQKNTKLLNKLGIAGEFNSIKKLQAAADDAVGRMDSYAKDVVKNIFGVDPKEVIGTIINSKDRAMRMKKIVERVSGNAVAIKGLRTAFAKHFTDTVESLSKRADAPTMRANAIEAFMKENEDVMKELYRGAPEKLKALENIQKVYRVFMRNSRAYAGVGSDTTTKLEGIKLPGFLDRRVFIARLFLDKAQSFREGEVMKLIDRAVVDADFAELLMSKVGGPEDLAKKYNLALKHYNKWQSLVGKTATQQKAGILGTGIASTQNGE